ncbi:MAG: sigma 54-interacting transcriptional regulator [Desulfomonile tiedjei]|nr:sigma 54-interacting transcriptional regulator [Desulfomonile tiedjei]
MERKTSGLELKVLFDISQIIGQALDLDRTLEVVLGILSEYLSMKRATITLVDEEEDRLRIRVSHGLSKKEKSRGVYHVDEGVTGLIFRTGEPAVVPDISREPLFLNKTKAREIDKGTISFIGVPVVISGKSVGVLSVDRLFEEEVSFEEDVRFLTILAAVIAQLVSLHNQVKARERNLIRANRSLKAKISRKAGNFFSTAKSAAMVDVQQLIRKVAPTRATVLLLGESGTGKTLVAQIIHELSNRNGAAFMKVNCAAVPENLLESELFGHEKGSFTGASEARIGRVEEADGGTLFLDEIGDLAPATQAKLLRFLQDKEFERLGSNKTRTVDVRVIAATNRDLEEAVRSSSFRSDLFYRLNVFPIRVPAVRERREDIEQLVGFFTDMVCREYACDLQFKKRALQSLVDYSWPGNVREMENLIERLAIISSGGIIDVNDLAPYIQVEETQCLEYLCATGSLAHTEKVRIQGALDRNRGIQSRAAGELGITLRQIGYKIKKYGLQEYVERAKAGS